MNIRKALILVTIMLLLSGMAPGYRVNERISYKPSNRHIYLIQLKLYIDRTGNTTIHGVSDEYWSDGYIDLAFRIPPNPTKIRQAGTGTGQRIVTGCSVGECATMYMTHPVVYEVVQYKEWNVPKKVTGITAPGYHGFKTIGWRIKIRETWKPGKSWSAFRGWTDFDHLTDVEGFVMGTYWVLVPFRQGGRTTSSWTQQGLISWKNKFKVRIYPVDIIGNIGEE